MTPSQITRTINWIAMPIALAVLGLVSLQIYQRHFVNASDSRQYQFDDLPMQPTATISTDINAIIQKHVFGQEPKAPSTPSAPVVRKPEPKPAPKTRLNLKLTGVIDGSSPENGMAILEVERGKTLVVAVGEQIGETDAVLHQVLPGEVLIDRDGSIESVKMERKTLSVASLDPALSSNLPQPYVESDARRSEIQSRHSKNMPTSLPGASQSYQGSNSTEATRSGVINRFPTREGLPEMDGDDERKLPVPRALRSN